MDRNFQVFLAFYLRVIFLASTYLKSSKGMFYCSSKKLHFLKKVQNIQFNKQLFLLCLLIYYPANKEKI